LTGVATVTREGGA